MTWHPIETYPVKPHGTGPRALLWSEEEGACIGDGRLVQEGDNPHEMEMVFFDEDLWPLGPTHWMPLPEAPK